MKLVKLVAVAAVGAMMAGTAIAAPVPTAETRVETASVIEQVGGAKAKRKAVAKKRVVVRKVHRKPVARKRVARKVYVRRKGCGTYKYWSRKARKCMDARNK
jgi:hypothetical protein